MAALVVVGSASAQSVIGRWEFNDDLNAVVGGNATVWELGLLGNVQKAPVFMDDTINGEAAKVAVIQADPTDGANTVFRVTHTGTPNGNGTVKLNSYTLVMDVYFDSLPGFISLLQTDANPTANDGDWFVRSDGGMGISGNYTDANNSLRMDGGVWRRIILTNDTRTLVSGNQMYFSYVDGALQNQVQSPSSWGVDGRFGLPVGANPFWLFADEDGEVGPGRINSAVLIDGALTPGQVAELGAAQAAGIPGIAFAGTATLSDSAAKDTTVKVGIYTPGSTTALVEDTLELPSSGKFSFYSRRAGAYDVVVKPRGFLAKRFAAVTFPATTLDAAYIAGDIDNDNMISVFDYDKLSSYFDKGSADADWMTLDTDGVSPSNADIDGDGSVSVFDYDILSRNFDIAGE